MAQDVGDRLREFIGSEIMFEDGPPALDANTRLLGGILDSLDLMRLVSFINDDLGVQIEDSEITKENFETLGDIERLVSGKVQEA